MNDHKFIQEALKEGGVPIGAILVENKKIIGRGHNRLLQNDSVILHGEMDCMESAGRLKGVDYKKCTLYTTLSPCPMCSGAVLLLLPVVSNMAGRPRFPSEYDFRVQVTFSGMESGWNTVHEFEVDEVAVYDMVYALRTREPSAVRLVTDRPGGILYTGREYIMLSETDSALPFAQFTDFALEAGSYRLEVRSDDSGGRLELYASSREVSENQRRLVDLLQRLDQGLFSPEDYSDEAYEMIYRGKLADVTDEVVGVVDTSQTGLLQLSVFVMGQHDQVTIHYVEDNVRRQVLTNVRATIGYGFRPNAASGRVVLSSTAAEGEVVVFVKR